LEAVQAKFHIICNSSPPTSAPGMTQMVLMYRVKKVGSGTFMLHQIDSWVELCDSWGHVLRIPIGRWCPLTSSDCRIVLSGIHAVPIKVSQMSPLLHTSTTRPRSRRFISLGWQIDTQK